MIKSDQCKKHNVSKFLLTLTNVKQNMPSLTMEEVKGKLVEKLGGKSKLVITIEYHKSGRDFHYHVFA